MSSQLYKTWDPFQKCIGDFALFARQDNLMIVVAMNLNLSVEEEPVQVLVPITLFCDGLN